MLQELFIVVIKSSMSEDERYDYFLITLRGEVRANWYKKAASLAKKAGITQGHLSKILNEKTKATFETQSKIAKACGYEKLEAFIEEGELEKMEDERPFTKKDREALKASKINIVSMTKQELRDLLSSVAYSTAMEIKGQPVFFDQGKETGHSQQSNIIDYQNPIKVKHYQKVNEFSNPEQALALNSLAVELDKIDPKEIDAVINFIKFRLDERRKNQGTNQANGTLGE